VFTGGQDWRLCADASGSVLRVTAMRRNRKDHGFVALRVSGGILPPEFLRHVSAFEAKDQNGVDYWIPKSLNVRDEIGRYWSIAKDLWTTYRDNRERTDVTANKVGVDDWLIPLLEGVLGHRVETGRTQLLQDRQFPIMHQSFEGAVPLVLTTQSFDLDKAETHFGDEGKKRAPHGLVQEYLNAEDAALWGIVSNGTKMRLLRDNPSLTRPAYIEVDFERIFEDQLYPDFAAFWLMFHASRVAPHNSNPSSCLLEAWRRQAHQTGERALNDLRKGVEQALRDLGNGFINEKSNDGLRAKLETGELSSYVYFQELLRLVYRFLFLFTVEERELLHAPDTSDALKEIYLQGYSLARLRERAGKKRNFDQHYDLWEGVLVTFKGLSVGAEPIGIPALGGLFVTRQCPTLDACKLSNAHLLEAIRALSYFRTKDTLARINYRDMDTEELGSVYESLLELHPQIDAEAWKFGFIGDSKEDESSGSDRKMSGSYYSPPALVNELIKSTLEPIIENTISENRGDPRQALLNLNIVDPSCGSGHFLLAAARRLASEIAKIEAGADTPDERQRQHALREVVQHCIYGVDKNPLSVELCKTALWIETIEPSKPLTFLDSHILCGDSLVGILDPNIMEEGIPAEAYKTHTGDENSVASDLKKRNKAAGRHVQGDLFNSDNLEKVVSVTNDLSQMPEDTLEQIEAKRIAWLERNENVALSKSKLKADLYVGAFFALKTAANLDKVPTTEDLNRVEKNVVLSAGKSRAVAELAAKNGFFHWHVEFSSIMNAGGFDVILGNPPWDVLQMKEEEFFASRIPSIITLNSAKRKIEIKELKSVNPSIWSEYQESLRLVECGSTFIRFSDRFKLTAYGKLNTYALFAELSKDLSHGKGRSGIIVPSGILSDDSTKAFFGECFTKARIISAVSFENEEFIFKGIANVNKFTALTLGDRPDSEDAEFAFYIRRVEQIRETMRYFSLSQEDLKNINPNTRTCPVFRSEVDAELTKKIYRRTPVLIDENMGENGNPWGVTFRQGLFNMASDSSCFRTLRDFEENDAVPAGTDWVLSNGERYVRLYEGKFVWHYNHRSSSYHNVGLKKGRGGRGLPEIDLEEYQNKNFSVLPRYWVPEREVTKRIREKKWTHSWLMGWRDVTSAKVERTVVPAVVPLVGVGHKLPLFFTTQPPRYASVLLANLSSIVLDYVARQKLGGVSLAYFYMKQFPILPPTYFSEYDVEFISNHVLELVYNSDDIKPFAQDLGCSREPFEWNVAHRSRLQAELDAYFAHLYGLTRDELRYILCPNEIYGKDFPSETFRVLKEKEVKVFGEYRTQRLILEAWDRFSGDGTFRSQVTG
jgi:hypothetical protein